MRDINTEFFGRFKSMLFCVYNIWDYNHEMRIEMVFASFETGMKYAHSTILFSKWILSYLTKPFIYDKY